MKLRRLFRHLLTSRARLRRCFTPATLAAVKRAITEAEQGHRGEIRFVAEAALDPLQLVRGLAPRERAIELFSELRMWDTEDNSGVLIYVLLADHAIEIVADRGIHARSGPAAWAQVASAMEAAFAAGDYRRGALLGVEAVAAQLQRHVPLRPHGGGELPDDMALL